MCPWRTSLVIARIFLLVECPSCYTSNSVKVLKGEYLSISIRAVELMLEWPVKVTHGHQKWQDLIKYLWHPVPMISYVAKFASSVNMVWACIAGQHFAPRYLPLQLHGVEVLLTLFGDRAKFDCSVSCHIGGPKDLGCSVSIPLVCNGHGRPWKLGSSVDGLWY